MDISKDELRRQLRDLDAEHREVMPKWRDSLMRLLVDDTETPTEAASTNSGAERGRPATVSAPWVTTCPAIVSFAVE